MSHVAAWVDLGNGEAIGASRVRKLTIYPPVEPSRRRFFRTWLEVETWTVHVLDDVTSVWHTVGCYWSEDQARAHARRIVNQMLGAA